MNKSKLILVIFGILGIGLLGYVFKIGLFKEQAQKAANSNKINIVASFYPLYYFSQQVAGDKAVVTNITPAGAEPHDYEPSTHDIAKIENSQMLVLNGGQLETWGDKIKENISNKNVKVVNAGENLFTQEVEEEGETIKDPHVWLDPILAKAQVSKITDTLVEVDSANKAYYLENQSALNAKLDSLDALYRQTLSSCKQKNIITSHAAFGYVASRYGLKQVAITGISPDEEPSPQQLGEVAKFARENNVKYIFFETLLSPKLSETIAKEVGAQTLVFNPLEGLTDDEIAAGKDYFTVQKDNLESLNTALECK